MSRDELIPEGIPKDKEEMENLLVGYGVSFTSSLADKLMEIMQLVRADAFQEIKEHFMKVFDEEQNRIRSSWSNADIRETIWFDLEQMQKGVEE